MTPEVQLVRTSATPIGEIQVVQASLNLPGSLAGTFSLAVWSPERGLQYTGEILANAPANGGPSSIRAILEAAGACSVSTRGTDPLVETSHHHHHGQQQKNLSWRLV